eukprot:CAMPEP_0113499278 /NCGR_PEP_ID=MMETSP0014_2-20120614/31659_1 /TAXON_ID=2857 /ORGANISM="Nitzschia sp." /LENGTH=821 /DNA_ID=CAMNT_0000393435 /DNA_START=109 /DNA_END=2574 /DNA_ORIENTATION=+ /assembly_acc=CAM_ASM_000159
MTAPIQSSWVGPTATNTTGATSATSPPDPSSAPAPATKHQPPKQQPKQQPFYALVVDSGVIVKSSGEIITKLRGVAQRYVCPYGVIEEIRDSRSRQALQQAQTLLDLTPRHPTPQSIEAIIEFSKQTGDFPSLSTVDIHVLALTLDMEREGCSVAAAAAANDGSDAAATTTTLQSSALLLQHIRTTPKRTLGLGKITQLNNTKTTTGTSTITESERSNTSSAGEGTNTNSSPPSPGGDEAPTQGVSSPDASMFILDDDDFDEDDDDDDESDDQDEVEEQEQENNLEAAQTEMLQVEDTDNGTSCSSGPPPARPSSSNESSITNAAPPKSWAALVNPNAATAVAATTPAATVWTASTSPTTATYTNGSGASMGGQFDDADDDDDKEGSADIDENVDAELEKQFPSLAAASTVPVTEHDEHDDDDDDEQKDKDADVNENHIVEKDINDGDNNDLDQNHDDPANSGGLFDRTDEEKKRALQPVSKSGRLYNTLGKYKKLALPSKQLNKSPNKQSDDKGEVQEPKAVVESSASIQNPNGQKTKILTTSLAETMEANDDDGEGWISSVSGIRSSSMNFGSGAGTKFADNANEDGNEPQQPQSTNSTLPPPRSCRSACTTTDFAMQNVLLQMNLLLWSAVDGMEIKRLKTWVIRCGVCYKVHPADDQFEGRIKRMFCSHCGSGDMMQRVSASVDGKTGRLKLHFSRKSAVRQKHANARGTKFSLPKAGTHNRFQGDLLLREDQLLMGAWNQKMKIKTGRKQSLAKAESIFGKDLSTSVGGAPNAYSPDDIRVGFGAPRRHNPNSAKGRERRGKKKKSSDRACGMRRY